MLRRTATTALAIALLLDLSPGPSKAQSVRPANAPPALQAVLADAASRTGVDRKTLQVPRMEAAEWPDGGLGCPQPGQLYTQMITPGWLVEVQAGNRTLEYHTDNADHVVFCAER